MTQAAKKTSKSYILTIGLSVLSVFFTGLIIWSIYFPLEIRVIAPAEIVGDKDIIEIRALSSGVVRKIHVDSGQEVQIGDILVELEDSDIKKQINIADAKLDILQCRLSNLNHEMNFLNDNVEKLRSIVARVQLDQVADLLDVTIPCSDDLKSHRIKRLADNLRLRLVQLRNLQNEIENLETQIELTQVQLASLDSDVNSRSELAQKKVISDAQLRAVEREYTSAQILLAGHKNKQSTFKGRVVEIKAQANVDISNHMTDLANEIRATKIRQSDEISRLSAFDERIAERVIHSPIEGTVIDVNSFVMSNFAQQSELLMKLAPRSVYNLLKARVAAEDIDNIIIDQNAHVRFPTYAKLRDLLFEAEIRTINPIKTKERGSIRNEETSFEVVLRLADHRFDEAGQALQNGTPAEILFAAEQTTFAKALIRPISQNWPKIFEQ